MNMCLQIVGAMPFILMALSLHLYADDPVLFVMAPPGDDPNGSVCILPLSKPLEIAEARKRVAIADNR